MLDSAAQTVYLKEDGAQIDLGGILKGYAADKASLVLQKNGISSGIVTVGGEVRAFGNKPDGTPWIVGIQNPRQKGPNDEVIATIALSNRSISTSGDYIKFFEKDGVRYHHILNPKTGYPAEQCGSVTVIANDGVTADGFFENICPGTGKGSENCQKSRF